MEDQSGEEVSYPQSMQVLDSEAEAEPIRMKLRRSAYASWKKSGKEELGEEDME